MTTVPPLACMDVAKADAESFGTVMEGPLAESLPSPKLGGGSEPDTRAPSDDETVDTSGGQHTQSGLDRRLYDILLPSVADGILFGWWPRSSAWSYGQLVERTTRCLPAVRPALDLVALPDLDEVHDLWAAWAPLHGLDCNQAIWFPPLLGDNVVANPACMTCTTVLREAVVTRRGALEEKGDAPLCFYPMYVTDEVLQDAKDFNLHLIGDAEKHSLMALSAAKAWMHPPITTGPGCCPSSLRTALPSTHAVRGPYGYVAFSTEDLHKAWDRLHQECPPGTPFVLKPANGSGGCGVILNATAADLEKFDFNAASSAILEEMVVGCKPPQSPTLYMIGDTPCGFLADQVLSEDGATNLGNKYPSSLRADLLPMCVEAAQAMNQFWKLKSNWGLDYVINSAGIPIIVDLNMGRPNGNFAVRMWASRSPKPLSIYTSSWLVPTNGPTVKELTETLRSAGLLWNGSEGTIVYQHFQGAVCSYAVASASGAEGLKLVLSKLSTLLERFDIVVTM